MKRIILASTSPRRKELLEKTGLVFEVASCDYQEDMTLDLAPEELAKFLSKGKAESVVKNFPNAIIISADTFVCLDNEVLGKPHTAEKAKIMLKKLSGRQHSVLTGFTIIDTQENKIISKVVETKVYFKNLSDKIIDDYIQTGEPLDRAGAYAIHELGSKLVEKIEGDFDSAVGLPIDSVLETLKEFGIYVK